MKEEKQKTNLTVSISPELHKKIKENSYNANSLVNQLIKKYLEKNKK